MKDLTNVRIRSFGDCDLTCDYISESHDRKMKIRRLVNCANQYLVSTYEVSKQSAK